MHALSARFRLPLIRKVAAWAGLLALVLSAGCVTAESEIPWNAPQSWEGSPLLPGLSEP
ncbi:MAG: hypothetical protein JW951_10635 [Lentisphaerae bacterium]|nr:hypothetical protein [Lentisphaerota bacterium]